MIRNFFLRAPDPAQGGDPAPPIKQPDEQTPNPPPGAPAPPPAGKIVVEAPRSERELELEAALERERQGRKQDQVMLSELEDENHRLKEVPREKSRAKAKKESGPISRFFGWDEED